LSLNPFFSLTSKKTSTPAPEHFPDLRASNKSFSSTMPPLAQLTNLNPMKYFMKFLFKDVLHQLRLLCMVFFFYKRKLNERIKYNHGTENRKSILR
jgi:hypothetical protein